MREDWRGRERGHSPSTRSPPATFVLKNPLQGRNVFFMPLPAHCCLAARLNRRKFFLQKNLLLSSQHRTLMAKALKCAAPGLPRWEDHLSRVMQPHRVAARTDESRSGPLLVGEIGLDWIQIRRVKGRFSQG